MCNPSIRTYQKDNNAKQYVQNIYVVFCTYRITTCVSLTIFRIFTANYLWQNYVDIYVTRNIIFSNERVNSIKQMINWYMKMYE